MTSARESRTSTAYADPAAAPGPNRTAVGSSAAALGPDRTAVGSSAAAPGPNRTAVSSSAAAPGPNRTAVGSSAAALGPDRTADLEHPRSGAAEPVASARHSRPRLSDAFRQPRSVWAIAFAATVSFMGIGLVDPILPAISSTLGATHTQAMLLFTSYLFITAIAMFFTSWISSRLGTRATLLIGLALIVAFAGLAAAGTSVDEIIALRGGWGLGNALFISTALAAIVGATAGPSAGAIMLYETALGIGMAVGPLLGGLLGSWSWRAPFGGTAVLMALGFIAIVVLLERPAQKPARISPWAAFQGLRDPALRTLSLTAVFYNFAFFALLAYTPFPLEAAAEANGTPIGAMGIGGVFFGWGLALALTSVFAAPLLTRGIGLVRTLVLSLLALSLVMLAMAAMHASWAGLVVLIVVGGLFQGIMNTALTETVMEATTLPRSVASSAYSGVRFFGGAISSASAGPIAAALGAPAPYIAAAVALLLAVLMLALGHRHLARVTRPHLSAQDEAAAIASGDEA